MSANTKDYRAIARILGEEMALAEEQGENVGPLNITANRIGNWFRERNPRFDEGTWYGAISDQKEDVIRLIRQGAISKDGYAR